MASASGWFCEDTMTNALNELYNERADNVNLLMNKMFISKPQVPLIPWQGFYE